MFVTSSLRLKHYRVTRMRYINDTCSDNAINEFSLFYSVVFPFINLCVLSIFYFLFFFHSSSHAVFMTIFQCIHCYIDAPLISMQSQINSVVHVKNSALHLVCLEIIFGAVTLPIGLFIRWGCCRCCNQQRINSLMLIPMVIAVAGGVISNCLWS
jgi:hypothetical protein